MLKILFLFLVLLPYTVQARLLNDGEMHEFMGIHKDDLAALHTKTNFHMAYCVVELAKQRMNNNDFVHDDKEKAASYYGQVILSALKGIGFGGLSKDKVASTGEQRAAYFALYSIGINLPCLFNSREYTPKYITSQTHQNHFKIISDFLYLAQQIGPNARYLPSIAFANRVDETTQKIKREGKPAKAYTCEDFAVGGGIYKQYKLLGFSLNLKADEASPALFLSTSQYLEKLRAQREAAEAAERAKQSAYAGATGKREDFRRPEGFGGPASPVSASSGVRTPLRPKPPEEEKPSVKRKLNFADSARVLLSGKKLGSQDAYNVLVLFKELYDSDVDFKTYAEAIENKIAQEYQKSLFENRLREKIPGIFNAGTSALNITKEQLRLLRLSLHTDKTASADVEYDSGLVALGLHFAKLCKAYLDYDPAKASADRGAGYGSYGSGGYSGW